MLSVELYKAKDSTPTIRQKTQYHDLHQRFSYTRKTFHGVSEIVQEKIYG